MAQKPVVLVDIDGTIADVRHRLRHIQGPGRKNWKRFFEEADRDTPIRSIIDQLRELAGEHRIVIFTGRPEDYRARTQAWLKKNGVPHEKLLMRRRGDHRPDYEAKREMLEQLDGAKIALAIDDREPVCDMLRELGIRVQQVDNGEANKQVNEIYRQKRG